MGMDVFDLLLYGYLGGAVVLMLGLTQQFRTWPSMRQAAEEYPMSSFWFGIALVALWPLAGLFSAVLDLRKKFKR
jgi:hypothetical protein